MNIGFREKNWGEKNYAYLEGLERFISKWKKLVFIAKVNILCGAVTGEKGENIVEVAMENEGGTVNMELQGSQLKVEKCVKFEHR